MKRLFLFLAFILFVGMSSNVHALSITDLMREDRLPVVYPGGILDLSYLAIDRLDGFNDIPGIERVRLVRLRGNALKTINRDSFKAAKKLQGLDLARNTIEHIEPYAFRGLKQLKVLLLGYNAISVIPEKGWYGVKRLRFLSLYENPMSLGTIKALRAHIPRAFIYNAPIVTKERLKKVGVAAGVIATVLTLIGMGAILKKSQDGGVARSVQREDLNVKAGGYLDLSRKGITTLAGFQDLFVDEGTGVTPPEHRILQLDLSYNNLVELPHRAFDKLKNLGVLNLSHNNLHAIDASAFGGLNSLAGLDLSYNQLDNVDAIERMLHSHSNIKFIDVACNNLTFEQLSGLKIFCEENAIQLAPIRPCVDENPIEELSNPGRV